MLRFIRPLRAHTRLASSLLIILALIVAVTVGLAAYNLATASPDTVTTQTLYGAGRPANPYTDSVLYVLNPSNGAVLHTIGPMGAIITGLAVDPTSGIMYGVTGDEIAPYCTLVTVNKNTGAITPVGPETQGCPMADIAFDSNGDLFGFSGSSPRTVYAINKHTGATTSLPDGSTTVSGNEGNGIAIKPGTNRVFVAPDNADGKLYTMTYHSQILSAVQLHGGPNACGSIGIESISALEFNSAGTLYGSVFDENCSYSSGRPSWLVIIDRFSGSIRVLGPSAKTLDAIAFDPPSH